MADNSTLVELAVGLATQVMNLPGGSRVPDLGEARRRIRLLRNTLYGVMKKTEEFDEVDQFRNWLKNLR